MFNFNDASNVIFDLNSKIWDIFEKAKISNIHFYQLVLETDCMSSSAIKFMNHYIVTDEDFMYDDDDNPIDLKSFIIKKINEFISTVNLIKL